MVLDVEEAPTEVFSDRDKVKTNYPAPTERFSYRDKVKTDYPAGLKVLSGAAVKELEKHFKNDATLNYMTVHEFVKSDLFVLDSGKNEDTSTPIGPSQPLDSNEKDEKDGTADDLSGVTNPSFQSLSDEIKDKLFNYLEEMLTLMAIKGSKPDQVKRFWKALEKDMYSQLSEFPEDERTMWICQVQTDAKEEHLDVVSKYHQLHVEKLYSQGHSEEEFHKLLMQQRQQSIARLECYFFYDKNDYEYMIQTAEGEAYVSIGERKGKPIDTETTPIQKQLQEYIHALEDIKTKHGYHSIYEIQHDGNDVIDLCHETAKKK